MFIVAVEQYSSDDTTVCSLQQARAEIMQFGQLLSTVHSLETRVSSGDADCMLPVCLVRHDANKCNIWGKPNIWTEQNLLHLMRWRYDNLKMVTHRLGYTKQIQVPFNSLAVNDPVRILAYANPSNATVDTAGCVAQPTVKYTDLCIYIQIESN